MKNVLDKDFRSFRVRMNRKRQLNNSRSLLSISVMIMVAMVGFEASSFESAPSMIFVDSSYSGHEEITRQALNNTAKRLNLIDPSNNIFDLSEINFNLKAEPRGLQGYKAKNLVISGNFASDFPKQATTVNLIEFWKNPGFADFENPKNQVIHFLRNYKSATVLASAKETCLGARQNIKFVTNAALERFREGKKSEALFLIGHALHMIQDSFSPAHTIRASDEDNYNIKQICFYGVSMFKKFDISQKDGETRLCYHSSPDSKDAIWNVSSSRYKEALKNWKAEPASQCDKNQNYPETEQDKNSCLSNEARLARVASEKYLLIVFGEMSPNNITPRSRENLEDILEKNLFDGPVGISELDEKMPQGIMRCEGLSTAEIIGSEPMVQ